MHGTSRWRACARLLLDGKAHCDVLFPACDGSTCLAIQTPCVERAGPAMPLSPEEEVMLSWRVGWRWPSLAV